MIVFPGFRAAVFLTIGVIVLIVWVFGRNSNPAPAPRMAETVGFRAVAPEIFSPTAPLGQLAMTRHFATVDTAQLNLRAGPGVEFGVIRVLNKYELIELVAELSEDWQEVIFVDKQGVTYRGYAHGAYLKPN